MAERDHWIGAGCAECRNVTGEQRDGGQRDGDKNKCRRIKGADAVEQGRKRSGREESENQSDDGPDSDKLKRVSDDQAQNVPALRAQRHSHTNFVRALHDQIRNHSVNSNPRQ